MPPRHPSDPWRRVGPSERGRGSQGGGDNRDTAGQGQGHGRGWGSRGWGSQADAERDPGSRAAGRRRDGGEGRPPEFEDGAAGWPALREGPLLRWMGRLSPWIAVCVVAGGTLLGVIGTLVTGKEPGFLLGLLIVAGCVVAALGIERRALYLLIPLPAVAFFLAAVLTGAVHDKGIDTSKTELAANFLVWIANVFFAMCAATILILVIGGARWLLARQLVSGQFSMSAGRPGGRDRRSRGVPERRDVRERPSPRERGPWRTDASQASRGGSGAERPDRHQEAARDRWRDASHHFHRGPRDQRDGPAGR